MTTFLIIALFAPLIGALSILMLGRHDETRIARLTLGTISVYAGSTLLALLAWTHGGFGQHDFALARLYGTGKHSIDFILFFDKVGAVFLAATAYIASIIVRFSRFYMHREEGYQRFFVTILCFIFGMNLLILAGSINILFAGWEIVGIASFLLIGFYRQRSSSVRNAFQVYSIYRICDIGVLLSVLMGQVIWHQSLPFSSLNQWVASGHLAETNPMLLFFFSLLLLFGAAGKSAQFPFCFWLPRAMEGPTPSSAIFYGALSIHAGVFLLLRMYPIWSSVPSMNWIIGIEGALTVFIATLSGRAQSNIKGQIAYASITQVGIILIELAFGLTDVALVHFAGNAGLRCYQLLVSPSAVAHLLRMQGHPGAILKVSDWSFERLLPTRWRNTFYVFALNEGFLYAGLCRLIVHPIKWLGEQVHRWDGSVGRVFGISMLPILYGLRLGYPELMMSLAVMTALLMFASSLSALTERKSARRAWHAVGFSSVLMGAIVAIAEGTVESEHLIYLFGVVPGWIYGVALLHRLEALQGGRLDLEHFHGIVKQEPLYSVLLFLSFLILAAFPIGPGFIGEELILEHAVESSSWLAAAITAGFILNGISLARIYTKVCLGPGRAAWASSPKLLPHPRLQSTAPRMTLALGGDALVSEES